MKDIRQQFKKILTKQGGQVLILVLVVLVIGSLILAPLLAYMATALNVGMIYEDKATDYYSADAGVEDALWQIKYDNLSTLIPAYDIYGFDVLTQPELKYDYPAPLDVNDREVDVSISNIWIPKGDSLEAEVVAEGLSGLHRIVEDAKLVVAGSSTGTVDYKTTLSYVKGDTDPVLYVSDIGVWFPPGFDYDDDANNDGNNNDPTCNLETNPLTQYRPTSVEKVSYAGGKVVIWHFDPAIRFIDLPGAVTTSNVVKADVTFQFTSKTEGGFPDALSWIDTTGVSDIPFAWDADVRVFKIHSVAAGGTEVEAYGIKTELRQLAKAIAGEYEAIGNSLLSDDDGDYYHIREHALSSSDAETDVIPEDAEVAYAYLYWSGWFNDSPGTPSGAGVTPLNPDNCSNLDNWTLTAGAWSIYNNSVFRGHYSSGGDDARYLTMISGLDLSAYSYPGVTITWQHAEDGSLESADSLQFQCSGDGGNTWSGLTTAFNDDRASEYPTFYDYSYTIPALYLTNNFKMRFYLAGFDGSGEYCFVDNIDISVQIAPLNPDTCANFNNWSQTGNVWSVFSGSYDGDTPPVFRGQYGSGGDTARYLTLALPLNLSAFSSQMVTISWQQWETGSLYDSDGLYYSFWDGSSWSDGGIGTNGERAFRNDIGSTPVSFDSDPIPSQYLTANFKMRFYLAGFGTGKYCYIDNIALKVQIFTDTCSNFDNWSLQVSAWSCNGSQFVGQYIGGVEPDSRYLTLTSGMDLSAYATQMVHISWNQWAAGTLSASDALQFQFSGDGGTTWSGSYTAAQDDVQSGGFYTSSLDYSLQIPVQYLTNNFKVRLYLSGFSSPAYCYLDNIAVETWSAIIYEPCSDISGWTHDVDWLGYYNSEYVGTHVTGNRYLTMSSNMDLSAYAGHTVAVTWEQRESGDLTDSDGLYFSFWNGSSWSDGGIGTNGERAFRNDIGSTPVSFGPYTIPSQYLTANFRMRFYINGFGSGKYCYVDEIIIYDAGLGADTTAFLQIDGTQVYFDQDGVPQQGAQNIEADRAQVIDNSYYGNHGYSYSSFKDVTLLVRAFCEEGPNGNRPGNGTYTVGGVDADTGDQLSYAGWSLIIIYTHPSPFTHQLYLYDTFMFAGDDDNFGSYFNIDFDQDGSPGGTMSGFLVPDRIGEEENVAKITCFVGEGDEWIFGYAIGDYIALNNTKLWDGINCYGNSQASPLNVWNSLSLGLSADGVDVDTFYISWDSNILEAGDTAAQIDIVADDDNWNLIFVILSFRSQPVVGGTITYLIK